MSEFTKITFVVIRDSQPEKNVLLININILYW